MKNNPRLPFLRTENLVVKELPNELLIYDLEKNKAFCLNETARLILDECDGQTSIEAAQESLERQLKVQLSKEMIWMIVEQLKNFDMIEKDYEVPVQTTKVTRRKILQSAAALGIALPMITSLVAPISAHAQSGCVNTSGSCTLSTPSSSNCCPNLFCVTGSCATCIPLFDPSTDCLSNPANCCGGFCASAPGGSRCFTD